MSNLYTQEDQALIQKTITFLVENFNKSSHNTKPVILHSIKIAMHLFSKGAKTSIVIGALLHDMLEDTDVTLADITKNFGEEVANLVVANSFKSELTDYVDKYIETFERNIAAGEDAVLIKAVDLLDNADYYCLSPKENYPKLFGKLEKFIEMSEPVIGESDIWNDLVAKMDTVQKQLFGA